jgi:hypothetical protein
MPYINVGNLVTVTKRTTIDKLPGSYAALKTTAVRMQHQVFHKAVHRSHPFMKTLVDLSSGLSRSQSVLHISAEESGVFNGSFRPLCRT